MIAAHAMSGLRRGRWAVSFADLCLLLLGFFVLLQASTAQKHEVMNEIARQFGARAQDSTRLTARELFQPGEAILTEGGKARIAAIARAQTQNGERLELHSVGLDPASASYDSWDLAAARLGALARALTNAGLPRNRLVIRGLDQSQKGDGHQAFTFVTRPDPAS